MTGKDAIPSSIHPPLLPTPEDEQFARLRLLRSRRVGIATYKRLLTEHGTAQNALAALPEVARAAGVSDYRICPEGVVHAELSLGLQAGAQLIHQDDPAYPPLLAEIDDAPPLLWALGDLTLATRPCVSIVGTRNASSLGTRMAKALAAELGRAGFSVVSGLARGIDTATHIATLDTGAIAVQAGGIDVIYPAENANLALQLAQKGLRLSEQPPGLQPMARHFPSRNRIISGLSRATVVVEAAAKSGSLITARDAADQGRDVLAVPGHPFDARAAGCNLLLRDGATLVRNAADVIEAIGAPAGAQADLPLPPPEPAEPPARSLRETAALHGEILARLGPAPVAEDQLIRDLGAPAAAVAPALVDLELDGRILRKPGGLLARAV